jgi:hypothetical protein
MHVRRHDSLRLATSTMLALDDASAFFSWLQT